MRSPGPPTAALAALFVLAACDGPGFVSPEPPAPDAAVGRSPIVAQPAAVVSNLASFPSPPNPLIQGDATLFRAADGVTLRAAMSGLEDGHAFTLWFVVFDNPAGCVGGCGADDVSRASARATVVNGGGDVAVNDAAGVAVLRGELARHNAEGAQVLAGDAKALDNPYRAEIHVIVRSHGPAEADPGDLALQTSQVLAFCNLPPAPDQSPPMSGCQDQGLIVFLPPEGPPGRS